MGVQILDEKEERYPQRDMRPSGWEKNLAQRGKTCQRAKKLAVNRKYWKIFINK